MGKECQSSLLKNKNGVQQQEGNNTDIWLFCDSNASFKLSEKGNGVCRDRQNVFRENTKKWKTKTFPKCLLGFREKEESFSRYTNRKRAKASGSPLLLSWKAESYSQPRGKVHPGVCPETSTDLTCAVYCLENSVSPSLRTSGSCVRTGVSGRIWPGLNIGERIMGNAAPEVSLKCWTELMRVKCRGLTAHGLIPYAYQRISSILS